MGETVKSAGVEITGKPFYFVDGQSTSAGVAIVRNVLKPGEKQDISMGNINLDFDFGGRANGLSLLYSDSGGNVNLQVNGDRKIVADLLSLHGQQVGGVGVSVTTVDGGFRLTLDGGIDQFAIGGQEFALDEVAYKGDGRIAIPVDDSSDELVVSVGWQFDSGGTHQTLSLIHIWRVQPQINSGRHFEPDVHIVIRQVDHRHVTGQGDRMAYDLSLIHI